MSVSLELSADDIAAALALGLSPHIIGIHRDCDPRACEEAMDDEEYAKPYKCTRCPERFETTALRSIHGGQAHVGWPGRGWAVPSSDGTKMYAVSERADSVYGGTYFHCECPSWGPLWGKGRDCKHIASLREVGSLR